jgi:hypothetical protein
VGEEAGEFLANLLGVDKTAEAVHKALENDPEAYVKLQVAMLTHKEKLEELALKEDAMYLDDRASARNRQIEVIKARNGKTDYTQEILAYAATLGFFGAGYMLFTQVIPVGASREALLVLMGTLSGTVKDIFGFYFGSSKGSRDKDTKN